MKKLKSITAVGEILFDILPEGKKLGGAPFNFIYHINKLLKVGDRGVDTPLKTLPVGNLSSYTGNIISRVGNDPYGAEILSFMEQTGISTSYLQSDTLHPTGSAFPVLDQNKVPQWQISQNSACDYIETNSPVIELINSTACLYYGTLAQRSPVSRWTIQNLWQRGSKLFCDLNLREGNYTPETILSSVKAAHVLKCNMEELAEVRSLLKLPGSFPQQVLSLMQQYNIQIIAVTSGADGAYLFKDGTYSHHSVTAGTIADTVGAGDAYAAVLCLGWLAGALPDDINRTACAYAAESLKHPGALF